MRAAVTSMRRTTSLMLLGLAAAGGALLLAGGYRRAAPLQPRHWRVTEAQAVRLVLDRLRAVGQPVAQPYVVARLHQDALAERRLQLAAAHQSFARLQATGLPD